MKQNFKKALELWEFLEQFDNLDLTTTTESNKEESNNEDKIELNPHRMKARISIQCCMR